MRTFLVGCPCGTWIADGFDANGTVHKCLVVDAVAAAIYDRVRTVKTLTFEIAYEDEQAQFRDVARIAITAYLAATKRDAEKAFETGEVA